VIEEVPTPVPGPGQIRIDIHAAGINPNDLLKLRGEHHEKPQPPFSPGSEVAGIVGAIGPGVTQFTVGDRVMATTPGAIGGMAEAIVLPADLAVRITGNMDFTVACGWLSSTVTAYDAVVFSGRPHPGETVLVLGAGGGVGLPAIEIAKALGCRVIAVAGSDEKLALARAAGADELIHHTRSAIRDEALRLTQGRGVDVIIDPVGGDAFRQAFRCLAWQGRLVVTGFTSRDIPEIRTILLLLKGVNLCGSNLSQTARHDPVKYHAACTQLFRWYDEGKVRSHVVATYPLKQVAEAMHRISGRDHTGKVAIRIRD
jgi:NADPH2:quinone reductase